MPIIKSAHKALRQTKTKTVFNRRLKDAAKKAISTFKKSPSQEKLSKVFSALDKAHKRNLIHKNKIARTKQQLNRILKQQTKRLPKDKAPKKTVKKASKSPVKKTSRKKVSGTKTMPAKK
ncbi:MAG: 30S ribosomal protein S20 [Patescibacteria group bacterium]